MSNNNQPQVATKDDVKYFTLIFGGSLLLSLAAVFGGSSLAEANAGNLVTVAGNTLNALGFAWVGGTVAYAAFVGAQMRNFHFQAIRVNK